MTADSEELRAMLPDIIRGTLALEPDGTFIQTVAFTGEASAREGQSDSLPV
jgi:hypothetical protein